MLWFSRPEFDRYARFKSHGSVREVMDWEEMCKVELPVPDIEKQRKIVKAYKTITDRIALKQKINDNLEETIKETLKIDDGVYYYALSDLACEDANKLNECCDLIFLETRNFRCLKTNYDKDNFYHKLEQSELYNFIRAGSVFFVNEAREQDFEHLFENENLKNIGFNRIIKIGGNN